MGEWVKEDNHKHDMPKKVKYEPVAVGSLWRCACGELFEVTSCVPYVGEVLRTRPYILTWKEVPNA